MNIPVIQWKRQGAKTAAAGTAIRYLLDPATLRGRVVVTRLSILNAATVQTLTAMQVLSKHRIHADAAAGQAVIRFLDTAVPVATMAVNDIITIKMPNGRSVLYVVSAVSAVSVVTDETLGTYTVTLTANLTDALEAGAAVCFFGLVTDGHETVSIPASTTTTLAAEDGYFGANEMGEPMILSLNNITNAATVLGVNCPVIGV